MKLNKFTQACLTLATSCLIGGCATEPSLLTGEKSYYGYSWEQELELGRQHDTSIVQEMGLYQDDELAEYVKSIGENVLDHSSVRSPDAPEIYRNTEFTFRLLDSPVVNAFALPGGYIYVTRGLLAHMENEAQLAVVMGHEIVHVEARHASQQALKQQWGQIGLMAGAIIGQEVMENKELARQVIDVGGSLFQLATLKYGRDAERESDQHGVEYAAKAGFEASEGSEFFRSLKRMSEKSGQALPSWMSSHPDPGEREQKVQELAAQWQSQLEMDRVGRDDYLRRIEGLIVGENPRNGFTESGRFLHPELRFQFDVPPGWQVQNQTSAVYLLEANGQAMMAFSLAPEETPVAAAQSLQQRLQMQPTYAQDQQINSMPAYVMEGAVQSQSGPVPVFTTFIGYQDKVYMFLGYGAPASFAGHKESIRRTAGSFQELTDERALNIQPHRLAVRAAERSAPFRELLPSPLPSGMDELDWAIINQVELDEPIEKGRLLKLPAGQG